MVKVYIKNILLVRFSVVFFIFVISFSNILAAQNDIYSDYRLLGIAKVKPKTILVNDKQILILSEYLVSNLLFINRGQDLIADRGLSSAISSVGKNPVFGTSYFGAVSLDKSKYKVGSGLNVNGVAFISGLAQRFKILTAGAFFEYGSGNYDSTDNFENLPAIKGNGNKKYIGGGLLCRLDLFNKFYLDFSGRKGLLKSNFCSLDLTDIYGNFAYYDCDLTYSGSHAGIGCKLNFYKNIGLDIFSKYLFTHQDSKENIKIYAEEMFNFSELNSQRLLCGLRLSKQIDPIFSFYSGLSAEYEFLEDIKGAFVNKDIDAQDLKDYTETVTIGILGKSKSCNGELSLQSYLGMREGFAGTLKISFAFFDYLERFLGYSLEKFENEKVGRFNNTFHFPKKKCFFKVLEIIKELNGRITHKSLKKGYIVAFDFSKSFKDFCLDSTEACIYVQDLKNGNVNVEVVSNNNLLSYKLSKKLFQILNKDK
jgi:hypothetical protein